MPEKTIYRKLSLDEQIKNISGGDSLTSEQNEVRKAWAEERAVKELLEVISEASLKTKPRRKRKVACRSNHIRARLTDVEFAMFLDRVDKTGLTQSDFIRKAVLESSITIEEHNPWEIVLLDEMALLRCEIGRVGGLLTSVIRPNEGQRALHPEEWTDLIETIRSLERAKKLFAKVECEVLSHGNHHS